MIKSLLESRPKLTNDSNISFTIYLHIGSPKAGSSALQKFLLSSRKSLEKLGFYYPQHGIDKNGVSGGHAQLWGLLRDGDYNAACKVFSKWIAYSKRKGLNLVISSESFFHQITIFERFLLQDLGLNARDIRIIAFIPPPINYLMGNYNQGIKRHNNTWPLISQLSAIMQGGRVGLSGAPLIRWADSFGDDNCLFLTYQKPLVDAQQIEAVFLEALGVLPSEISALLPERKITNRSYVRSALELKRILNTVLGELPQDVAHEIDWSLQAYSDLHPEEDSVGSQDIPAVLYREINEKFLEAMEPALKRFPSLDRKALFPPQSRKDIATAAVSNPYRPLAYLEEQCPKELEAIRKAALEQYQEGQQGYTFLKLLDLLGISFEEPEAQKGLSARARGIIGSSKMKEADRLRELGAYFEQQGLLDDALILLDKALEARPGGRGIKKIKKRALDKKYISSQMNYSDTSDS